MNKDSYKIIVRKVVDKVTGAIQTRKIPQTQEKIDHYLLASKPKLIKLLQCFLKQNCHSKLDLLEKVKTCVSSSSLRLRNKDQKNIC
ncbi:hypothetical protein YC2023_065838 [Brassica napus]